MQATVTAQPSTPKASNVRLMTQAVWLELRRANPHFVPYTIILTSPVF